MHNDNTFAIGQRAYTNGPLHAILSERCNIFIGDDALFSFGIWLRNADPHLVYSAKTMKRVNLSRDVLIGDHVWIGQSSLMLKGTIIGSGAIVGGHSVVAGKRIPSNTSWAGNPARCIAADVFFDSSCVHRYTKGQTSDSEVYDSRKWIYTPKKQWSGLEELRNALRQCGSARERLELLDSVFADPCHDRFAVGEGIQKNIGSSDRKRCWFSRK